MKNFTVKFFAFIGAFIMIFAVFSTSSCKKDPICHGKVHVIDTAGAVVPNASVRLDAPSANGDITYTELTDGSGDAAFEVKLPAVFDVTATKAAYPGMRGTGILRLDEPGKTKDITVVIR
jgi:hypothetical protein